MSEPATTHVPSHDHAVDAAEPRFVPEELVEFKADDAEAGKNIGKMLVLFFLCLFVLVTTVNVFTNGWVKFRSENAKQSIVTEEHHDE